MHWFSRQGFEGFEQLRGYKHLWFPSNLEYIDCTIYPKCKQILGHEQPFSDKSCIIQLLWILATFTLCVILDHTWP